MSSDTDFFLNQTGGSVSQQLGTRLNNVKNQVLSTQSVIGIQPDNSTDAIPYTAFGKSLLNVSTLNGLVGLINSADTNVSVIDSGIGQIDFTLDNALKLSVKNAYTEVLNELRTLSIIPTTTTSDLGSSASRFRNLYTTGISQVKNGADNILSITGDVAYQQGIQFGDSAVNWALVKKTNTTDLRLWNSVAPSGDVFTIKTDGKVGVGTTTPATTLDVNGATTVRGHITPDATNQRDLGTSSLRMRTLYTTDVSVNGNIYSATTATPIIFAQDTSERARINASGQLEVKTATINNGAIKISTPTQNQNQYTFLGFSGDGTDGNDRARVGCKFGASGGGNLFFTTGGSNTQVERMVITDTGVGIGNTAPKNLLQVGLSTSNWTNVDNPVNSQPAVHIAGSGSSRLILEHTGFATADRRTAILQNSSGNVSLGSVNDTGSSWNNQNIMKWSLIDYSTTVSGNILPDSTANVREIGASGNKFNNVYSTTFTGALSGNASSATFASIPDTRYVSQFSPKRPTASVAEFRARQQQEINELCEASAANTHLGVGNFWGVSKTIVPWSDPSGGRMYQYFYSANGIVYFRKSDQAFPYNTEAWTAWRDASPDKCILTDSTDTISGTKTFSSNILFDADNQRNVGSSGQALNSVFAHTGNFKSIAVHSATGGNIGSLAKPFDTIYLLNADIGNLVSNIKSMNITPTATNTYTIGSSSSTQYNAIYGNTVYGNGVVLTSDINKKKDIQPIEDALSIIMRFESKSFKFKDGTSNRTHTGFIAQQIKEVIPDDWALYCDNKLGDIGLKYTEIICLNTRAIQQLNERLSKVESRKLVGSAVIDTSGLTEDFVRVYERLEALESEVNKPVKPQLHRCIEVSRINELFERISNLECNESKSNSSEDFELIHSLMEKNHKHELRINELENKLNQIQSQPKVESKSVDFLAESDGGLNMVDMLQTKNYELEQRILKLEKQNKKLVQAVNRLLKTTDE